MSNYKTFVEIRRINHLLPYADQIDAYADAASICLQESFRRLISSGTYLCHHYDLVADIRSFIELFGFRFTKEEFIAIVKFGLGISFCHQTDVMTRRAWQHCVMFLISNAGTFITKEELELDWKLFRNDAVVLETKNDVRNCSINLEGQKTLEQLIICVKRFFPVSCIEQIWDYFKGGIYRVLTHGPYEKMFHNLMTFTPFYPWTFDEISRVWLNDIFYIWYKYPKTNINKEIIPLLGYLALAFPGRIDWEPHLDRIFNLLLLIFSPENAPGGCDHPVILGCANIVVHSIVAASSTLDRLRDLFEVCRRIYHPSTKHASTSAFFIFCKHLLLALRRRLLRELNHCPETATIFGELSEWVRLTREQVDYFVNILAPICLDTNLYTTSTGSGLQSVLSCIQSIVALRPRLLFPRLLENLEEGFLSPELPLRTTRPLMALAYTTIHLSTPTVPVDRVDFTAIGYQPADQPQNYVWEGPRLQTAENAKHLNSHLSSMFYPEGRVLVPRILRCCLACLDLNHRNRLRHSILALNTLFLTMPMENVSDDDLSDFKNKSAGTAEGEEDGDPSLLHTMRQHFSAQEVARASVEVEDLVVQVFVRILHLLMSENEATSFHVAVNETEQESVNPQDHSFSLASLAVSLAISVSPVPRLRVRLVKLLTEAIFQNQWNTRHTRLLSSILFWLISGRRGVVVSDDGGQLPESDIALFALRQFWPRFSRLFDELNIENNITRSTKADPHFLTLLGVLPAYFCALVPSHLTIVKSEFIYPVVEILSRLLTVSIGSDGVFSPSPELAWVASECAGALLYRLVTFSLNFDNVDFFTSLTHCPPFRSAYLVDPLWTPYVSWREMLGPSYWDRPTPESFAVAEHVIRVLFLPTLAKISTVTQELSAYIEELASTGEGESRKAYPQLPLTSGQSCTSLQRLFLIAVTIWVKNIAEGMLEGLKPRNIDHADAEYVKSVCTELEVMQAEIFNAPLNGSEPEIKLDIPFFDVPAASDGACLREQIFRVGLEFLNVFAKLSTRYDNQITDSTAKSSGQSIIGALFSKESLERFVAVVALACTNLASHHYEPPWFTQNLRNPWCVEIIDSGSHEKGETVIAKLRRRVSRRELPALDLACLRTDAVWRETEASALFSSCRLPANPHLLRLVEICTRIGLASHSKGAFNLALKIFQVDAGYQIPGAVHLVAQLILNTLKQQGCRDLTEKDSVYRVQSYYRKRAILLLNEIVKTRLICEIIYFNPRLWAEIWLVFAKSALFTHVNPIFSPSDSSTSPNLSRAQRTERYIDQEEVCLLFEASCSSLLDHSFLLYFPASLKVDDHPLNSPLRSLIVNALSFLKILGGSEAGVVESPLILVRTMALRREAYRFLTHALYTECLEYADITANYSTVVKILSSYPLIGDDAENPVWEAALPRESGGAEFRLTAPPPPPPRAGLVRKVLDFLTSERTDLASAATDFIISYLQLFLLRSRPLPHILVEPNATDLPVPRNPTAGLMLEPYFDCLSSDANFTRENHIYNLSEPFFYFDSPKTWVDPLYTPIYPTFSGPEGNELSESENVGEWMKPRPEMDCSPLSPEDWKELREGLMATARHFASRHFWSQLSHRLLYFHRCVDSKMGEKVSLLIISVLTSFGPRPFLRYLEDFIMSLIQPALSRRMDGVVEFVGPTLAIPALQGLVGGSLDWPREARFTLFARVLPRLLVAAEAASQLASMQPIPVNVDEGSHEALRSISFISLDTAFGAVGGSFSTASENAASDEESARKSDQQAYRILSETWPSSGAEHNLDCAGPKTRLPFPIMRFLLRYTARLQYLNYLAYVWRFFHELAMDAGPLVAEKASDPPREPMIIRVDERETSQRCGHRVPEGYGECPVCLGLRLFPDLQQRRALFHQVWPLILLSLDWAVLHLCKYIPGAGTGAWESLVCSVSPWTQKFANAAATILVSARFDSTLSEASPLLRLYSAARTYQPPISEHLVSSPLETKLIAPLVASTDPKLATEAVVGPEFVMRRFLPLLVRDSLTVLVLKGIVPSEESFTLQNNLLADALKPLTPATLDLLNCTPRMKWLVSQRIKARLTTLFSIFSSAVNGAFPVNPSPEFVSVSRDSVFFLLAPLLADIASSSNLFWTSGKSAKYQAGDDKLNVQIASESWLFYTNVLLGHTRPELSSAQANRMLDILMVFLLHTSWKTRVFGLKFMRHLVVCNISAFWRNDEHGKELRSRLKECLSDALLDPWVEVAREACEAIAYTLQLGILKYEDGWFRRLVTESRQQLGAHDPENTVEGQALRRRHASVLGLCAFIKACEFDTPDYLPSVIAEVAKHAHDPQPIAKSVADTLTAYSHSHHEIRGRDRSKFSEAQPEVYCSAVSHYV